MSDGALQGWQAQLLRVTLFTLQQLPGAEAIWRAITGGDPEIEENRIRENTRRQLGPYGSSGVLEVQTNPVRVDIILGPNAASMPPQTLLGPAGREIDAFIASTRRWLEGVLPNTQINRLAFGGVVLLPVDSSREAYEELSRLLPAVQIDRESTRELLYRINRPKPGPAALSLNRITNWSALIMRLLLPQPGAAMQPMAAIAEQNFVRLEFDNNSPADRTDVLPLEVIIPTLDQLVQMAHDNMQNGERP